MSAISASQVKELRDQTGAGMMDAKRALEEAGGDLEEARRLLRERGMATAAKRADRVAAEGEVLVTISGSTGTIVAVGCETDFVAKNDDFLAFAERVLEAVEEGGPEAVSSLDDQRKELVGKLGENVVVVGADRLEAGEGESLAEYVHPPANKIGVLVRVKGENPVEARRLAMHISFSAPRFARRDEVPEEEIASEREIYSRQPDVQSKPDDVRDKIVDGMLAKRFFAENVLEEQQWIHDTSKTVGQALQEATLQLLEYRRFAVGA